MPESETKSRTGCCQNYSIFELIITGAVPIITHPGVFCHISGKISQMIFKEILTGFSRFHTGKSDNSSYSIIYRLYPLVIVGNQIVWYI